MVFTIPLYKRKPTISVKKEETKIEKVVNEAIKEKAKIATDAAIEQAEKTAKDKLDPIKKLALAIGVAGTIALMISGKPKPSAGGRPVYIYGDHCTVNIA